jgi:aminoglycoside phosphotransferase (APT) family kinase protein
MRRSPPVIPPLANPEAGWDPPDRSRTIDPADIERRVGPVDDHEVLAGGHANLNVRIADRVLRIHRRDPAATAREAALLRQRWSSFVVPELFASGDDFVLVRYVPHRLLDDGAAQGVACGRALAEIHARRFAVAGFLDGDLRVVQPLPDFIGALCAHVLALAGPGGDLRPVVVAEIERRRDVLAVVSAPPVLLHGDFKVSNLHWADEERLLVLDWEFAHAGPALMDIGQLIRWSPSRAFLDAFAAAYRSSGGTLPERWERWASLLDLANLCGLLASATEGSQRARDVRARIEAELALITRAAPG